MIDPESGVPPPLATPLRRLAGFAIDSVIYAVILFLVLVSSDTDLASIADGSEAVPGSVLLVGLLIAGVYQVTLTALRGQTVGKMVVHTRVVDAETGGLPSWQNSFIRWGAPTSLSTVPWLGYVTLLMYGWILWDPRRQGLHDKAARTLVIQTLPPLRS